MTFPESDIPDLNRLISEISLDPNYHSDGDDDDNKWVIPADAATDTSTPVGLFIDPRKTAPNGGVAPEGDEDSLEKARSLKNDAAEKASEGDYEGAVKLINEALAFTADKAMYWAQRGEYFLKLKAGIAAIHDASVALDINPDSMKALKVRGICFRHYHKWEDSARDLNKVQQIDFSDSVNEILQFVQPKANSQRDRRRNKELAEEEKRMAERLARQEELRAQRQREQEEEAREEEARAMGGMGGMPGGMGGMPGGMGGMPGGMGGMPGGMGGMPGGMGGMPGGMEGIMNDPEIMEAMKDPETAEKISTLMSNPMAAMQMMGDPKMGPLIQKIMSKMMGGMMGGMPGGMGGMPGGMGGMPGGMGGMPGGMGGMPGGAGGSAGFNSADNLD